jgi:hypothetical protein
MRRGQRSNATRVGLALIVALLVAGLSGLVFTTSDDDNGPTTTTLGELSDTALELLELLQRREDETFHAVYEGTSPDAPGGIRIETWQEPPQARQDTALGLPEGTARTSTLVLTDGAVRCAELPPQPMACRQATAAEAGADDPTAAIAARLREGEVTVEDTTIERRRVRCFTHTVPEGATELCVTDDTGITVRVTAADSELRLVTLDEDIPAEVFTPPAPVA